MALNDQIEFHAATDVGRKRSHNEDNYLVDAELGLFVVADGMGGHAAGEVASAIAVRTVHEVVKENRHLVEDRAEHGPRSEVSVREILSVLELAIQTASQRIHAEAQQDGKKRGMGTTCSVLLVSDSYAYVAHVGDSRIYLHRGTLMHQVTEDHTVANELIRLGMVSPDQLDKVPRRNAITRAVGVYQHAEVDTLTLEVLPNDRFLLCSDGLYGYFDESGEDLAAYLAAKDGAEVVKSLVSFANKHGGKDNITGVLVQLGSGDTSDSVRARRVEKKREMLAALPLFSRLSERELLHVMQVADVLQYEAGEYVVKKGEHGDQMFVNLQGRLKVSTGPTTIIELGPGEHFGEMALIRNMPRSADVAAVVPSEVVSIRRSDFFDIIRTEPHIAVKLLWQFLGVLAHRLEQTSTDLTKAREQLGIKVPSPTWVDEEPSLDPFTAQPVAAALSSMGISLQDYDPNRPAPEDQVAQRADAPPLGAAPAMAHRIEDPPSFDSASGQPSPLAEPAAADRSRPRTKLNVPKGTLKMNRDAMTIPSPSVTRAKQAKDKAFDGKSTLPSQANRAARVRAATLKSAPEPTVGYEATQPAPESAGEEPVIDSTADSKTTRPDGEMRAARDAALSAEDGRRTIKVSTRSAPDEDDPEFRPTKVTIPLEPPDSLKSELDQLRKEFRERLKKSREARGRKDSD